LEAAIIVNDPLPVRLAGVMLENSSQLTLPDTVHVAVDVTVTLAELATYKGFHVSMLRASVGAAWSTTTVRTKLPAITVIVPRLAALLLFASATILNDPLPVRFAGMVLSALSQAALLDTAHVVLDVTVTLVVFDIAVKLQEAIDKPSVGGGIAPAWVIVKVRVTAPVVTVTVPVLGLVLVFSVTPTLKDPLPVRFAGVILVIGSQLGPLTLHVVLDLTSAVVKLPPAALGLHGVVINSRVAAVWVTDIVRAAAPGADTVIVPDLATPVLVAASILKLPLFVPLAGVTVSHCTLLLTLHALLDVTLMVLLLAVAGALFHVLADKSSLGGCAA